ncbi:MAG: hydroxypyruvate isomerase [Pirellulaceae bacterium]|nr:MAG: hydroxypyruvate isomerase [Pirellulaceae bacterium]
MVTTRREVLQAMGTVAAWSSLPGGASVGLRAEEEPKPAVDRKGRIRQSVMGWCFKPMPAVELARLGKRLGLVAIEGIDRKDYPAVAELGLKISLVGSHGFATGPVDPDNHAEVITKLREAIDVAVEYNSSNVITFTGMRVPGMSDKTAMDNCVTVWQKVIGYAEQKGVTLVLEHLNSRDDSHPMKGHPGYFGDDVDRCADLVRRMDSPRFKLLFDIYHVQVMHGDVIRRIRDLHPIIGHYHTAGNPGRCELDDHQELNYPPIMRAILETGYKGYVAQEFIPTWDDPARSLKHAIETCDV